MISLHGIARAVAATAFILAAAFSHGAESLDSIIIDAGYDRQTRIAVVPFRAGPEFGDLEPLSDIIGFDLARSGQFAPTERGNMLSLPAERAEVFFRDWRILGVEYLLIGRVAAEFNGDVSVSYELYDVTNERAMAEERLTAPPAKWRDLGHAIADVVFEAITGVRGAFSTRIVYVLAQNPGTDYARYRLEMADSDGARTRTLLTSDEPIMSPSWSPDAQRVAYVTFETGRPVIALQQVATGERELLPHFPGINGSPVFSPDGRSLAVVLSRDGNPEIYLMNLAD
ncbi:MAG: Tol-Pal system protein TolB, partial [Gammaproteobacteria bacterium]|nr:Tol-Pal system protein TolB [Gammaproteobacteria bacterium]